MEQQEMPPVPSVSPEPIATPGKSWIKWVLTIAVVAILSSGATYIVLTQTKQMPSPAPTAKQTTSQPTPSMDQTTNWKTYTSVTYKYTLKYPNTWETYGYGLKPDNPTDSNERFFRPSGQDSAAISLEISKTGETTLAIQEDEVKAYSWTNKTVETISIDGASAVRVSGTNQGKKNVAVVFAKGDYIYKMQTLGNYADICNQILSTFKFTE